MVRQVAVAKVPVVNVNLLAIVFAEPIVTDPLGISTITPPVAVKLDGHSAPIFLTSDVLYCKVALGPYVYAPVKLAVAVPSMEKIPFTVVALDIVFADDPEKVKL